MTDIDIQVKTKQDLIRDKQQTYAEHHRETEQALDMIGLRVKKQPMQKFVQDYTETMREGQRVIDKDVQKVS
jgi:hypothetical protein